MAKSDVILRYTKEADDWPWASALLRARDRLAGGYPKPDDGSEIPSSYRIVYRDEEADQYVDALDHEAPPVPNAAVRVACALCSARTISAKDR